MSMKLLWKWLVIAITKDDLLDRASYGIFGLIFLLIALGILIDGIPIELTLHAALTGWVSLSSLMIAGFFVFLIFKEGYKRKIMDAQGVHVFLIVFPAMLLTIVLRLLGVSGREYLENTKDINE